MAVRPRRKNPISTRPIYLPKVPSKALREAATAAASVEGPSLRIYTDGVPGDLDIEKLAQRLGQAQARPVTVGGELVSALVGRAQTEVRDAVAALANRVAWARIRDPAVQAYRVLPLRGEVDQEETRFRARTHPEYEGMESPAPAAEALYDGAQVQDAYRELLPDDARTSYVVVTDRRLARWDAKAKRWTASAVLSGVPMLVSVSSQEGPVDASALADEIREALERSSPRSRRRR